MEAQRLLVGRRLAGEIPDTLWLLEHPPTVTWGRAGGEEHVLVPAGELRARGVAVEATERGGDVTYHEPGQLVGYPVVHLSGGELDRDLHSYLRRIEDALVDLLGSFGLQGRAVPGRTGVWLEGSPPRKIAAIGVRCARWVTSHGFALNVRNRLEGFRWIVPCGIRDAGVTSLERELPPGSLPDWDAVCSAAHGALERSLGRPLRFVYGREGLLGS
jgi:lipoate-protein ligase B